MLASNSLSPWARGPTVLTWAPGLSQRGSNTGVVLVVNGEERIRAVLEPVYGALGLEWRPEVTGSVQTEDPALGWERVAAALVDEYARDHELVEAQLDDETLALARTLAPEHRPLVG